MFSQLIDALFCMYFIEDVITYNTFCIIRKDWIQLPIDSFDLSIDPRVHSQISEKLSDVLFIFISVQYAIVLLIVLLNMASICMSDCQKKKWSQFECYVSMLWLVGIIDKETLECFCSEIWDFALTHLFFFQNHSISTQAISNILCSISRLNCLTKMWSLSADFWSDVRHAFEMCWTIYAILHVVHISRVSFEWKKS